MKKFLSVTLCLFMFFGISLQAFALSTDTADAVETIYFQDGTYAVVETIVTPDLTRSSRDSKSAKRSYTYKNGSGESLWKFTLSASFSFDGNTARATSSSVSAIIYDPDWELDSKSTYRDGNEAFGEATFSCGSYSRDVSLSMTCDPDGTIY